MNTVRFLAMDAVDWLKSASTFAKPVTAQCQKMQAITTLCQFHGELLL